MEGVIAAWYAKNTAGNLPLFRHLAGRIAASLQPGARILEVAPGPGYLAIELARLGSYHVTGVDISRSFVRIAAESAARAGVRADFQQGDAAAMPFPAGSFDFIVCCAAFKNFRGPLGALREMHRVLRSGGTALIIDMRKDAPDDVISKEVSKMNLGAFSRFVTKIILRQLRNRAYTKETFQELLMQTPFQNGDISEEGMGLEVTLLKS